MLRSFRLANHRSFLQEQELLLMPSAPGHEHEVLTVAAIYGANASGKSNLLNGLEFMSEAVLHSFQHWSAEGGVRRKPYRLSPTARFHPSTFVVEVIIGEVPYTYGFSVDDDAVVEEWLYSYPMKRRRILFAREGSRIRFGTTVGHHKAKLEVLEELTRGNALFLSVAAQSNFEPLMPVYRWFTHNVLFCRGGYSLRSPYGGIAWHVYSYLAKNEQARQKVVELIAAADTGITDMLLEEKADEDAAVARAILSQTYQWRGREGRDRSGEDLGVWQQADLGGPATVELRFLHGDSGEQFGIEDESDGTRNWLDMLPFVLEALERGGTLVIDEIDASLHPLLAVRLLELFTRVETNPKHAQLIFTTHDTTPLGSYVGREILQRDHVWFVEKDSGGRSKLYPLSDFKPRIGENTEKRYLGGSYGAVPVLSDLEFGD